MNDELLEKVFDQIGYLLNAVDPLEEINKLVTLELTLNPELVKQSYLEILDRIVIKLVEFYQDEDLEMLWHDYLLSQDDAA